MKNIRFARLANLIAASALFAAACDEPSSPGNGSIQLTMITTGAEPDSDGYRLRLENGLQMDVAPNGSLPITNLAPGVHRLRVDGLALNCNLADGTPATVTVIAGKTVNVTITVVCVAYSGSIRVTTTSDGVQLDSDGYTVTVSLPFGTNPNRQLGLNDSATYTKVRWGDYLVELRNVARNCAVEPASMQTVPVVIGQVTDVRFRVRCDVPGHLRVVTATTGVDLDPGGYRARVSREGFDTTATLANQARLSIPSLAPVQFAVNLIDVSANCQVMGPNPRVVTVLSADTAEVKFDIVCVRSISRLAFVSNRDGNNEIYVWELADPAPTRLTFNNANDIEPAWSPDGKRIAFNSRRDGNAEIYVMDVDGSNVVRLTSHVSEDIQPAWSPDGERIVFESDRDGDFDIYSMRPDGSDLRRLTDNTTYDGQPSWSVNNQIAFVSVSAIGWWAIHVMNPDGSGRTKLTNSTFSEAEPDWSPDGTRIAFSRAVICDGICNFDIHVMNADGSSLQRINTPFSVSSHHTDPSWSGDGTRLAYSAQECWYSFYYGSGCNNPFVHILQLSPSHVIQASPGLGSHPKWR